MYVCMYVSSHAQGTERLKDLFFHMPNKVSPK